MVHLSVTMASEEEFKELATKLNDVVKVIDGLQSENMALKDSVAA